MSSPLAILRMCQHPSILADRFSKPGSWLKCLLSGKPRSGIPRLCTSGWSYQIRRGVEPTATGSQQTSQPQIMTYGRQSASSTWPTTMEEKGKESKQPKCSSTSWRQENRHQTFFGFSKRSCLALLGLLSLTGQGAVTDCAKKRGYPGADREQQLAAFDEMATVLQNHPTKFSSKHVPFGAPPPRPSKSKTGPSSTSQSSGSRQQATTSECNMSVVLVSIAASFFDDTGLLDCHASGASAQTSVRQDYACVGTKLDADKSQLMLAQRLYLGLSIVGRVRVDGSVMMT